MAAKVGHALRGVLLSSKLFLNVHLMSVLVGLGKRLAASPSWLQRERKNRFSRATVLGAGFVVASVGAYELTPPMARLDDAYIALHSARVLLSGSDPVFNVPALVGVTSSVHVAAIAGLLFMGVPSGDAALRIVNAAGLVAYVISTWELATAVNTSFSRRAAVLVIALVSGLVFLNLTNGMETGWAMAVLTFAIASAISDRLFAVACAAGLLSFLRPDLAPAAALLFLYAAIGRQPWQQLAMLAIAAAIAAPWLIWERVDTGHWLPQTMRAMQLAYAQGCLPSSTKARMLLREAGYALFQLFPLSLGLVALPRHRLGLLGMAAIATTLVGYYIGFPGAVVHNYWRYFYPLTVPWLCLGLAWAVERVRTGVALTVAVAVAVTPFVASGPHINAASAAFAEDLESSSEWIDAHVPEDAIVLVHDAGGISEFAHRRVVDLVGLKTPSSIEAHARWTWPTCGIAFGTAVAAIARQSAASYLVAHGLWESPIRKALEADGFVVTPERRTSRPDGYTVYRLGQPAHRR